MSGEQGCWNQSLIPSHSSAPLRWVPSYKAKHHTSSPFCGCGGTVSWRTPCPGAVEKARRWICVCKYSVYPYVCVCVVLYDIWLSVCGLFDVEALGCNVFLMHNKSCGEAQPNFRSLSFLRWPSNVSSWIVVMGKYTVCTSIKSMK